LADKNGTEPVKICATGAHSQTKQQQQQLQLLLLHPFNDPFSTTTWVSQRVQLTNTELSIENGNSCWYSTMLTHNALHIMCRPDKPTHTHTVGGVA